MELIEREKKVVEEHDLAVSYAGKRLYMFCLPLLEAGEALYRVLNLNREMHEIQKEKAKAKAEKEKEANSDPA